MIPMLWGELSPSFRANLASPTRANPPAAMQRRPKKKWWGDGGKSHGALLILIEVGFVFSVIGLIMSLVAFNRTQDPKNNSVWKVVDMKIAGLFFLFLGVLLLVPSGCVFMCRFTGVEGPRKRSQRGAEQQEHRARRARERGRERGRAEETEAGTDGRQAAREGEEGSRNTRRADTEGRSPRPALRPLTRSPRDRRAQGRCRNGSAETLEPDNNNDSRPVSVSPARSRGRSPPGPPPPQDFSFPPPPPSYASAINLNDLTGPSQSGRESVSRANAESVGLHHVRREGCVNQPPSYSSVADLNEVTIEVGVPRRDVVVRYQAARDNRQLNSPNAPPPSYEVALASRDERNDGTD